MLCGLCSTELNDLQCSEVGVAHLEQNTQGAVLIEGYDEHKQQDGVTR